MGCRRRWRRRSRLSGVRCLFCSALRRLAVENIGRILVRSLELVSLTMTDALRGRVKNFTCDTVDAARPIMAPLPFFSLPLTVEPESSLPTAIALSGTDESFPVDLRWRDDPYDKESNITSITFSSRLAEIFTLHFLLPLPTDPTPWVPFFFFCLIHRHADARKVSPAAICDATSITNSMGPRLESGQGRRSPTCQSLKGERGVLLISAILHRYIEFL